MGSFIFLNSEFFLKMSFSPIRVLWYLFRIAIDFSCFFSLRSLPLAFTKGSLSTKPEQRTQVTLVSSLANLGGGLAKIVVFVCWFVCLFFFLRSLITMLLTFDHRDHSITSPPFNIEPYPILGPPLRFKTCYSLPSTSSINKDLLQIFLQ